MEKGILIVVSGPSGAGKGTICGELIKKRNDIHMSISATSRNMRENDIEGQNYYFKTRDQFEQMINEGQFLEWVQFCDNYYGTPKKNIEEKLNKGITVILEIEVVGALNVKKEYPDSVLIFILPPTYDELVARLKNRGTEKEEEIEKRTKRAFEEVQKVYNYDYLVINDNVESAVERVENIINAEKNRPFRNTDLIDNFFKK